MTRTKQETGSNLDRRIWRNILTPVPVFLELYFSNVTLLLLEHGFSELVPPLTVYTTLAGSAFVLCCSPTDGGRRGLFQVSRFEDETHLGTHLDDLTTHQTKLRENGVKETETSYLKAVN